METKFAVASYMREDSQLTLECVQALVGPDVKVLHTESETTKSLVQAREFFVFQSILDLPAALINKLTVFYSCPVYEPLVEAILAQYPTIKLPEFVNVFIETNERWLSREIMQWSAASLPVVSTRSYVIQRAFVQERASLYVSKLNKLIPSTDAKQDEVYDLLVNAPLLTSSSLFDSVSLAKINQIKHQLLKH